MERRAASTESSKRDQDVKSEEVRRHESIREYKDVDRPLVLITQEQILKDKEINSDNSKKIFSIKAIAEYCIRRTLNI